MNISINSFDFDIHNVSFLEPKKNILMEGYFTKINYLSQWFTMSGLFFYLPIKIKSIIKEKSCIKFDPYLPENHGFIQKFAAIENYLLDFYNSNKQLSFMKQTLLSKQLFNGTLKINYEDVDSIEPKETDFIIKVSGIWQNTKEIGITYKLYKAKTVF